MGPIMAGLGGRGMRRSIPVFGGLKSSAERTPSESSGLRVIGVHVKMHIFGVPTLVRKIPSQMPPPPVQLEYGTQAPERAVSSNCLKITIPPLNP